MGSVLEVLVHRLRLAGRLRQEAALIYWASAVGPEIARHTRPLRVRGRTLVVQVRNAAWANQLSFLKGQILTTLGTRTGDLVEDIRWETGVWREEGEGTAAPPRGVPAHPSAMPLQPGDAERIEELTSPVADPEVRAAWAVFLGGELRRRAWRAARGYKPCPRCGVLHRRGPLPCPACLWSGSCRLQPPKP